MSKLVIVESPTKAKTISKYLGKEYKVESSFGHIRDLPKNELGVDKENNYNPKYVVPPKASKTIAKLKGLVKKAGYVILATDEDREGEAIAWHLKEALKIDNDKSGRIVFHEITKSAIEEALKHPRPIDMNLVDAQQARRILDRLVGYELSPFLWKKVARGLSAGRVQSVAVRLIVEREREIKAFNPEEYWSIEAELSRLDEAAISEQEAKERFMARLYKVEGKTVDKLEIKNEQQAEKIVAGLKNASYRVANVDRKQTKKNPPRPFTTSTLQQTANRWLGYSAKQTMMLAQQLYENGFITYMRTDSVFLSNKFLNDAKVFLHDTYGAEYALNMPRLFKTTSKGAQEAHEAIRPTEAGNIPEIISSGLDPRQLKLYTLIWQRAVASQMPEAIMDATSIDIDAKDTVYSFRSTGQTLVFDGYLKVYPEQSKELSLPHVKKDELLEFHNLKKDQHFTKPPGRYSDAGLVKIMEKYGIGRPSTYAPTIATIITRNYAERDENKKLMPTDISFVVTDLLVTHFKSIVDYEFTASMENDLDTIASGNREWQPIIDDFYTPFRKNLSKKEKELNKKDIMPEEESNEKCDKCGAAMVIKTGRYGKFYACSAYPDCKNIKGVNGPGGQEDPKTKELKEKYKNEVCVKCGAAMAVKTGRYGPFLACSAYPKCKNIKNMEENNSSTGVKCPVCGQGEIVMKRSRRGAFYACDQYPECKTSYSGKPNGEKCPECSSLLIEMNDTIKCSSKSCAYTK